MAYSSFDSTDNKKLIRQYWNARLLEFFVKTFGKKLIYFGLPAPNAEDIFEWIDYLDLVFAFQCRNYPAPSDPSQSDVAIRTLEKNLNSLQRKQLLTDFSIYDGYIEEVIINGKDNVNQKFELKDFITVYNLDFCNEITNPQTIYNETTQKEEPVYKLETIKRIIDIQRSNNALPFKFVIFLTVVSNLWETEAHNFTDLLSTDPKFKDYFFKISKARNFEKNVRILKLYIYQTLTSFLCANNYIPEFLPPIIYEGGSDHYLAHFTIIGTFETTLGRAAIPKQPIEDIFYNGFIVPDMKKKILKPWFLGSIERAPNPDPVSIFTKTEVYNKLWK